MRFFFTLLSLCISLWLNAQFSCPITSYSLTSSELGDISNNTLSYSYAAATYSMPFSVVVEKVAGNGPRLYRYTSTTGVWIGKDDDDEGIQPPVQEYNDIVITFSGDVISVYLDFAAINKNSDGEEQIQSIYPQTLAGSNITTGVSYFYEPGQPSGTTVGTYFSNTTKTIYARTGNVDNGRLHITSATPFRKIRFRWKEISDLSFSGPNGIVLNRIQYCPVLPEITCLYQSQTQAVVDTVNGPTLFPYQDSILSFTIRNVGSATLNLSNIQLSGNAYYQLLSPTSLSLAPAASSIISVRYNPLAIGSHVTNLLFQTNDFSEPNYNIRIQSQCSGPIITVENQGVFLNNPSSVSTSPTLLGQTDTLTFYIRNQGNTSLQVNSIQSTQSSQWTRLSTAPLNLASGQRDSFKVLYHPTVAGTSTLPVLILSNDHLNDSFRIVVQGISTQPIQISQSVCKQSLPLNWNGMSITQAGTYYYMSTNSQGFDSLTQLNLSVNNSDTVRLTQQICAQDLPYQWQQGQLTQSGTYQTLLSNRFGCDSLIILQLSVLNPPSTVLFDSICENNTPYLWQNSSIYASGQYVDTLISTQGCDSLVYLNLHLIPIPSDTVNLSICDNQLPYVWNQIPITQSGTYQYVQPGENACDSISVLRIQILQTDSTHLFRQECSNSLPLTWAGLQFTQAGTQVRTLINRLGCDSVVYHTLQILPTAQTQLSQTVCDSELPFNWNGVVFNQGGQNQVLLQNIYGCDSLVQMTLNVIPTIRDTVRREICSADLPFVWGSQTYSQSGMFSQLYQGSNGCDSVAYLILQVKAEDSTQFFRQECSNSLPLSWAGLQFTQAGTQSRTFINRLGCDSVVYYTLQILPVFQTQLSQTLCQNDLPFNWNGIVFTQSGQDSVMLQASGGCDSFVQMTIIVVPTFSDTVRVEICSQNLPYVWANQNYSQSGFYTQMYQSSNGCDSLACLILQVNTEDSTHLYRQECSNLLPLTWAGLQFTQAGTQSRILTNAAGCDSVIYYTLQILPAAQSQLSQTVCQNDLPISWNGIVFNQGGQNSVLLQTVGGCDSLVQMTLNVNPVIRDTLRMNICSGDLPFVWAGQNYNQSGFYTQMNQSAAGCDSISSLDLTVNPDTMLVISQRICQNQLPYTWNGQLFTSADTITVNYNSVSGCDSTVIMQLMTDSVYNKVVYRTICQNELPLSWNGLIFNAAGTQLVNYNSIHFCDSLVTYQLTVLPSSSTQQLITANSNATPYFWNGLNITQSGIYSVQLTAANGCDSIVSLSIRVIDITPPQIQVSYFNIVLQPTQTLTLPNLVVNQIYDFGFLVKNLGQSPLIISQISDNQNFVQLYAGIQNAINQLQSDSFVLRITPLQVGFQTVRVQINSNDPNIPIFIFNLAFKVINGPAPEIDLSYQQTPLANQATISLVNQPIVVGQTQLIQIAVQNIGTANLQLYQLLSNNPNVQIDPNYLNLLVPNAQTFIQLRYTPVQAGFELMKLTILNNDADESTTEINIRLQAIQPSLPEIEVFIANQSKANQSSHFMGTSAQGVPVQQQLQIKNIGNAALQVSQISLINNQGFSLQGAASNLTINPGNVANLNLNFSSQTIGSFSATVNILNNDSNENPYQIRVQAQVLASTLPNCSQCYALNVISNPLDNAEWIDNQPRLTWQHEEGLNISYYRLEMWVSSNNSWVPVQVNTNYVNQVYPTSSPLVVFQVNNNLSYFKEHKWKVTAYDSQNLPISCFTRTFLTQKRPEVDEWTCPHPNVPNFGTELGQFNNVPIYKNGGCENGVYDASSSTIGTPYYNSNFYTNPYGWQCAELPPRYYKTRFKINAGPGNGVDYNLVTGNRKGFKRFENGQSTEPPTTDDILARNSYSHQYGHVVIAKGGPVNNNASSSFRIIQQNYGSNLTAHINGSLPIKLQNSKYTITDRGSGIWLSWVRAKPELIVPGDDSSVPFIHSTTPDFRWARHSQIKGYQFKLYILDGTCYRLEHDIRITGNNFSNFQIPALVAGETYKWTVENIFHVPNQTSNWNKRVKSMANYFRVSTLATANRTNVPLSAMGEEEQFLWMQTLGSSLSGAEIWFKNDEDWLYTASTEQESANFLSSTYILPGDSLWISRKGYHDLKLSVETNLSARGKYYFPLFPKNSNPIKVDISASGHSLFVPANDIQLKLKGENYTNYQLFYDDVLHPEIYNYSDSIISIPYMEAGYQSVRVYAMNADDTLSVDYHFVVTDGTEEQMTLSLAMQKQQKVQVYLDRQFYAEINASKQFTLPRSHFMLTLKGHGLETQNFEIESDTIIQVELNASPWIMNSQSFDLAADESVYFDVYATIISEGQSRVELSSDSSFAEDSIYLALSETLHFTRKSNDANNMQLKWIVDKQLPESELFLRWEENGTVQLLPLFEQNARFTFEAETHLLHLKNIGGDFNASIVQKKQRSIFDENDNTLHLFPNPNSGNFTLFIPQIEGSADIEIFDVLGRLVHNLKAKEWLNHTIEISNLDLSAGNYFVKLNTGEKTYLSKLSIKQ